MSEEVEKEKRDKGQALTIKIPLFFSAEDVDAVRGSIREYRYVARRAAAQYACLDIATTAMRLNKDGFLERAEKISGKEDSARNKQLAAAIFSAPEMRTVNGDIYATPLDGVIKAIAPSHWSTESIQMCRREVLSRWYAKDPDNGIPLKYLLRSGERRPTSFNFAPFPILFCTSKFSNISFGGPVVLLCREKGDDGKEKLVNKDYRSSVVIRIHGKQYTAGVGQIDGFRHRIICGVDRFTRLQDKSIEPAGAKLKLDHKFRLSLNLGYYVPPKKERVLSLKEGREVEVGFDEADREKLVQAHLREGHKVSTGIPLDEIRSTSISVVACIAALARLRMQSKKLEAQRNSMLNKHEARNHARRRGKKLQKKRIHVCENYCHHWAKEIVRFTRSMNAATIRVIGLPKTIQEWPFKWSCFTDDLKYKAKIEGMKVVVDGDEKSKSESESESVA